MKSWWGKDTDHNISARSLTLLIFTVGWALCGQPQPKHESGSDATAVTFSVKCFNPLKLYPLSGNISRNWFVLCFILFIYSQHLIIMWSPTVNLIAVTTLHWRPVYIAAVYIAATASKEYLKRIHIIFYAVRINISLAILSEFFIQIGYFF